MVTKRHDYGYKSMSAKTKRTILRISVTPEFREELRQFCDQYGETYATVVRTALREFMAKSGRITDDTAASELDFVLDQETWERLQRIKKSVAKAKSIDKTTTSLEGND